MQAGCSAEQIKIMNRETLMSKWVDIIVVAKEASTVAGHIKIEYHHVIERQRLAWEIKEEQRAIEAEQRVERKKRKYKELEIR